MTDSRSSSHCSTEVAFLSSVDGAAAPAASEAGFEAIYEEHADFLYAVLRRLGLGPTAAEDALQDVFVVVHRRLGSFEGRGTLRSWLYGITVRVAREHRRKRSLARRFFDLFGRSDELERLAPGPDPHGALEASDALRRLDALLAELPEERREIFVLVEVAGFTAPEVAELLNVKLNTAYSRLRLARADVRAKLARARAEDERRTK